MRNNLNGVQKTTLDVFRIMAALAVIVGHSFSFYDVTVFKDDNYFPYIQNIGVVIFFILSGFLSIYSLNIKSESEQYSFSKFLKHKILRIAGEYIPGLMMIAIIDAMSVFFNGEKYAYYQTFTVKEFVANVFMLQKMGTDIFFEKGISPFGSGRPLWTMAVEWWLYMLLGMVFFQLNNKKKLTFFNIFSYGIVVFICGEYLITGRGNGLGFAFLLGILAYYSYNLIETETARIVFPISCLAYVIYGLIRKDAYTVYSFIILYVVICSALNFFSGTQKKRNPVLAFISKSTFILYLIHYSIIDFIINLDVTCSIKLKFFSGIVLSLLISYGAYYLFGKKRLLIAFCQKIGILFIKMYD